MAKRGRKPKTPLDISESQTEEIISLYKSGKTHSAIGADMNISEANIRQILKNLGVRRSSRKFCGLTEEQDEIFLNYLKSLDSYQGSYRVLRGMMEQFVRENDMQCDFSQTWRRSFHSRHQDVLPPVIRTLLSLRPDQEDTEVVTEGDDPERSEASISQEELTGDIQEIQEVTEETIEVDEDLYAAVQEALLMYTRAGLTEERARLLLRNMAVPGFAAEPCPTRKPPKSKKKSKSAPAPQPVPCTSASSNPAKTAPPKKTPLQLRVLEREFVKNTQMSSVRAAALGDKIGLESDQIISWFRNKRHKRPASSRR